MQAEMEKAIRFWMDTGLDGMVIDAVNWYNGCTWEITATDGSERILAVLNFQPTPQEVLVDLSPVAISGLIDLRDGKQFQRQVHLHVPLPAYATRFYKF